MEALLALIGYSKELEEKKRVTYLIAIIGNSQLIMFFAFYLIVTPNIWLIIETIIVFISYLVVFPILRFGYFTIGKLILIIGITLQVILLVFLWFPKETYFVLFFFIIPPITFFILDFGDKIEKIILFTVCVFVCLVVIAFVVIEPLELIRLDAKYILVLRLMSVVSTVIPEILVFYFYVYSLYRTNTELRVLANTDSLTNVSNRRKLFEIGEELFNLYKKHNKDFSLMILDIDHFKRINDTYGHPVGDEVLRALSQLIERSIRKEDLLCRYGGEEFAILFKNLEGSKKDIFESVKDRISNHTFIIDNDISIELTISAGVVSSSDAIVDFDGLVRAADRLLYIAKQSGRNCIQYINN